MSRSACIARREQTEAVNRVGTLIQAAQRERGSALMGVVNVTPDSFYDGGRYTGAAAERRVDQLVLEGADLIDVGGESSRPGATPVPWAEQVERIEPVVRAAVARGTLVSVDTTSPEVAEQMLAIGAHVINDVSCLADPGLASVAARFDADLIIMHSRGALGSMAGFSKYPGDAYEDVVKDVLAEWSRARARAEAAGVARDRIYFDPGIGFAKSAEQSFTVLRRLDELATAGAGLVLGPSRKSFIAAVDPSGPEERLGGTIAACLIGVQRGAAVLRVHDVRAVRQALLVARAAGSVGRLGDGDTSNESGAASA